MVLCLINNNEFTQLRRLSEMIEYQCLINPDKFKLNNDEPNFFAIYNEQLVLNKHYEKTAANLEKVHFPQN